MHFRTLLTTLLLLLSALMLLPVVMMVADAFYRNGTFDTEALLFLIRQMSGASFRRSFMLALLVAAATTVVATFLALMLFKVKRKVPLFWGALLLMPLLVPPYIYALGWYETVGRNSFLGQMLFGYAGVCWVLFWVYLLIPLLLGMLSLRQIDPRLEEAALLVTGWGGVLRGVTLPLMLSGMTLAFLLVFVLAFGEQSVANFLRVDLFAQESFTYFSAFYDFRKATVLAVPMVLIALLFLLLQRHFAGRLSVPLHTREETVQIDSRKWRLATGAVLLPVTGTGTLLPFSNLFGAASLHAWPEAFAKGWEAMVRSYAYASAAATLMTLLAVAGAFLLMQRTVWARLYDSALIFLFALPATVLAIAFTGFWNRPETALLYATPMMVLLAYTAKYLLLPTKIAAARFAQTPRSQIDAAALAGASQRAILRYIYLPSATRALLVGWLVAFIFSLRETTMTMLLYPPGYATLPVYILTQMANGQPAQIAVLATMMVLMVLLPLLLLLAVAGVRR